MPEREDYISLAIAFAAPTGATWFATYGLLALDSWTNGVLSRRIAPDKLLDVLHLHNSLATQQAQSLAAATSLFGLLVCVACIVASFKTVNTPAPSGFAHRAIWFGLCLGLVMHFPEWHGILQVLFAR